MIIRNMPFDEYAAAEGLNASTIKAGPKSMKHMKAYKDKGRDDCTALRMGRIAHSLTLEEGEAWANALPLWEGKTRNGKVWDAFKLEHAADIDLHVTPKELAEVKGMADAVLAHPDARRLIENMESEVSIFWESERYGKCKGRLDKYSAELGYAELKTTGQIVPSQFFRTSFNLGYHKQLGWCANGAKLETPTRPCPVHVIAVETKAPHDVVVYRVPPQVLAFGLEEAEEIAMKWRVANLTKTFSGVESEIVDYELPKWATEEEWTIEEEA